MAAGLRPQSRRRSNRRARGRIAVFATGGIGGVHRGALGRARSGLGVGRDVRHLVRPRGAGPDAHGRRVRRPEGHPGRAGNPGVPRDTGRAGQGDEVDLPGFYARSAGIAAPGSVPDVVAAAALVAAHLGLGLTQIDPALRPGAGTRGPRPRGGTRRDRASDPLRRGGGHRGTGAHAVAPRPGRPADRGRDPSGQHGPHRERRARGRRRPRSSSHPEFCWLPTEAHPGPGRRRPGGRKPSFWSFQRFFPGDPYVRLVRPARHRGTRGSPGVKAKPRPVVALDGIDLDVAPGEFFGLLGPTARARPRSSRS